MTFNRWNTGNRSHFPSFFSFLLHTQIFLISFVFPHFLYFLPFLFFFLIFFLFLISFLFFSFLFFSFPFSPLLLSSTELIFPLCDPSESKLPLTFLFLSHDMCLHMIHLPCAMFQDTCTRWKMPYHIIIMPCALL